MFANSNLLLCVKAGPTIAGYPLSFIFSLITSPSVQWSKVTSMSNSFAIRIIVNISSARCAWHFKGISFFNTGIIASNLISYAGVFPAFLRALSFFSIYSFVLYKVSLKRAAIFILVLILDSWYTRFGFSPKAHFMATGFLITISSIQFP